MMLRDTSELHRSLAKEAVTVLTGICVSVTDDVGVEVGDGQMAVHPLLLLNIFADQVAIRTENHSPTAMRCDFFISLLQILADEEPNLSVRATDKCQDWRFVSLEISFLESARARTRILVITTLLTGGYVGLVGFTHLGRLKRRCHHSLLELRG